MCRIVANYDCRYHYQTNIFGRSIKQLTRT